NYSRFDGHAHQRQQTENARNTERRMRQLQRNQRADRLRHYDPQSDRDRKLKVSVQRKQDHENQQDGKRTDDNNLRFRLEQFAVFAAPVKTITRRKLHGFIHGGLPGVDDALKVTPFHRKLHADVARIVFTINKRSAAALLNRSECGQRYLLTRGRRNQQIPNLRRVGTELRFHTDDKIEEFFALNYLRGSLAANRGLHNVLDLYSFRFQNIQIIAEDFYRQRALQAGQRLVHGVLGGLRVVEDHAGE